MGPALASSFGSWIGLTAVALTALLVAEQRGFRPGVWIAKPLAAGGFVALALAAGAADSAYGRWVLLALLFSWLGDVLLIPRDAERAFRAGLASFLLGHLVYVVAFSVRGVDTRALALAAPLVLIAGGFALRWLRPHLPAQMRVPVYAYVAVISAMLASAAATRESAIGVGALMFYVSDLAVARERFVSPSPWNRLWGLPLYFGGQLVLAATVAGG